MNKTLPNTEIVQGNPYTYSGRPVAKTKLTGVSSKSTYSPRRMAFYKYIRNYENNRIAPNAWYEVP